MRRTIAGSLSAGTLMALAMDGLMCVQKGNKYTIRKQEPPCQNILWPNHEISRPPTYGPSQKGKGGKVKRW